MDNELFSMLLMQIVQVTILAIAVWGMTRLFGKNRPHLSHALWMLVLLKCITPPIWSCPTSPFSWMQTQVLSQPAVTVAELPRLAAENLTTLQADIVVHTNAETNESDSRLEFDHQLFPALANDVNGLVTHELSGDLSQSQFSPSLVRQSTWVAGLWIVGAIVGLLVSVIRFMMFTTWLRRVRVKDCAEADEALAQLKQKLGIRRDVQVRVLESPVGPAVMGLIRPLILLPASVVKGKTAAELQPLLAHELIHIRRGDVWWALIQTIARNLFWFHPLVWLASAMVTRESERCCDEETVTSLGCSPATYARNLIEVLEQKQQLRVAPALPGVRPIDITSARLERVMKIGHGSHRRTPFWIWLVMLVGAAITLPGAALVVGQDDENLATEPAKLVEQARPLVGVGVFAGFGTIANNGHDSSAPTVQQKPIHGVPVVGLDRVFTNANHQWLLKSFNVKDLLAIMRGLNIQSMTPEKRLILELPCRYPIENRRSTPEGKEIQVASKGGEIHLGGTSPTMKIVNDTLYVYDTRSVIDAVERNLARLNEQGFRQIVVETRFLKTARGDFKKLGIDWGIGHFSARDLSNPAEVVTIANAAYLDSHPMTVAPTERNQSRSQVRAASFVEKSSPVLYSLLDDKSVEKLVQFTKGNPTANILQAPTVTMFTGQTAQVVDGVTRPFVVGLDRLKDAQGKLTHTVQPVIRTVTDGTSVNFKATAKPDESVDLDCHVSISKILSVDTAGIPIPSKEGEWKIQIPEVATSQIQSTMNIPAGKTLVLGSFLEDENGEKQNLLVMLKCRTIVDIFEFPAVLTSPTKISQAEAAKIIGSDARPVLRLMDANGTVDDRPLLLPIAPKDLKAPPTEPLPEKSSSAPSQRFLLKSKEVASEATNYQSMIDAFAAIDIAITVEGKIDYSIDNDRIRISGKDISFVSESDLVNDAGFRVKGKQGILEFSTDTEIETLSVRFQGDVEFQMDELEIAAEKVDWTCSGQEFELEINGNASAEIPGRFTASADQIKLTFEEDGLMVLEGNAHLGQVEKGQELKGDRIEWDLATDAIEVSGSKESPRGNVVDEKEPTEPSNDQSSLDKDVFSFYIGLLR